MILVGGYLELENEGDIVTITSAVNAAIAATLKESGCVDYSFAIDIDNPKRIRVFEIWVDNAALDAHMQTPHFTTFMEAISSVKHADVSISAYEANAQKKLM